MPTCKICKQEASRVFDGVCTACISIKAGEAEKSKLDKEHDLAGLQINTPIGDGLIDILRKGQGNFNPKNKQVTQQKEPEPIGQEDSIKVIKSSDYINVVYRPNQKEMFAGTIDIMKVDGNFYGVKGDNIWFFNRLFVPAQIRNKGVATKLLKQLVKILNEEHITLLCQVNPYGDLNEKQLVKLYTDFGFTMTPEGHMIYKG